MWWILLPWQPMEALSCVGPRWPWDGLVEHWHGFSRAGRALDTWVLVVLCQLCLCLFWLPVPFMLLRCLCCTAEYAHHILHFCWLQCKSGPLASAVKDYVKVEIKFRCSVLYYFKKSLNYFDIARDIPAARNAEDLLMTFFKSSQSPEKVGNISVCYKVWIWFFLKNCTYAQPRHQNCWDFMTFSFTFRTIILNNLFQ